MLKIDLHIHTIYSGHAYGTFYDILKEAKSKKMDMIAVTDHGPSLVGSANIIHFKMGYRAPKDYEGMKILWGCEANIISKDGTIDLDEKTIEKLDILLVGLHNETPYKDLGINGNTESIINCFKRYPIHIFTHPTTIYYKYDTDKVFQAACDNDILLELNLSSLMKLEQGHHRENLDYLKKMIEIVKKNKKKIIINSDAHFLSEIGEDAILKKYWNELKLNDDLIINNHPEELMQFIASKDLKNFSIKK